MADKIKVYKPTVIEDNPFPDQKEDSLNTSQKTSNDEYQNKTIADQKVNRLPPAKELISMALNTISKKITQAFKFTQQGAIQIGNYLNGTTGDIRISPDGITARNVDGETTFALDGTTGDASFKGEVQAGSILTGGVTITDESGTTIIDGGGLVSTASFSSDSHYDTTNRTTSSVSYVDIPGATLSLTLDRQNTFLILLTVVLSMADASPSANNVWVAIDIDGVTQNMPIFFRDSSSQGVASLTVLAQTTHIVRNLNAGNHTIKVKWRVDNAGVTGYLEELQLTYLKLGN